MRLLFLLLLLPGLCLAADDLGQKQQELKALKAQIRAIAQAVADDQQQRDTVLADLQRTEQRLDRLREALQTINRDLAYTKQRAEALQAEQSDLKEQLRGQYQAIKAQLRSAFVIGRRARSRMLLSQNDPARLARLQVYIDYARQQREQQVAGLLETLEAVQAKQLEVEQASHELKQMQLGREQTLAGIEQQRKERENLLAKIEQRLQSRGESMQDLQAQQARLEQLIDQLQAAVQQHSFSAPSGKFGDNRGRLVRPVNGRVLARYNERKLDGSNRWKGLWMAAEPGSPVRAVAAARVVYVGWMHKLGLLLVLDHGDGYFSLYGHNHSALASVGDEVAAGTPIAEAGKTGSASHSGVYLEIRKGRKTLNPDTWLAPKSP